MDKSDIYNGMVLVFYSLFKNFFSLKNFLTKNEILLQKPAVSV